MDMDIVPSRSKPKILYGFWVVFMSGMGGGISLRNNDGFI